MSHKLAAVFIIFSLLGATTQREVPKDIRSKLSNNTSWTGTLPETGDYIIFVEGDEKGSTYSLTVTIK